MTFDPRSGPRALRHAGAVVTTLDQARRVVQARLSAEAAQGRTPLANGLEAARMVPEKMLAFSAGGMALAQGGADLSRRALEYSLTEMEAAHRAVLRAATSRSPLGWSMAQMEWAAGAMGRAAGFGTACVTAGLGVAEASLRPVRRTVAGNVRRLR
ncbi:hypothetical protein [Teichococcus aerofrigidensis]